MRRPTYDSLRAHLFPADRGRRGIRWTIILKLGLLCWAVEGLTTAAHVGGQHNNSTVAGVPVRRQTQREAATLLKPGRSITQSIGGGESRDYQVMLVAGQFCRILVEQQGIDLVVAVYDPNGAKVVEGDSPNGANGPELTVLLAEVTGAYRVEIRSPEKTATAGAYEVTMQEPRAATAQDETLVAAKGAFAEAMTLRDQKTAESRRRAAEKYAEALAVFQTSGERHLAAYSLNEMGLIYGDLGEYQKALDVYLRASAAYQEIGDDPGRGGVLNNLGWVYSQLGEHQKAIDFYEQSRQASRVRKESPRLLSNLGAEHALLGEYRKALEIHQQVLALRRNLKDYGGQAITLNNIANCYQYLGEKQKALDYYGQALALMPALENVFYTATTLNNIGVIYLDMGERQKAWEHFTRALSLRRTIGDRSGEAATLSQIARLERDRGDLRTGLDRIEAALAAVESLRANVASPQLRASYFASVRQYHEFNIDLLMRLHAQRPADGFDARALRASEKARARSLLELLAEARADIRQGVAPDLLERERAMQRMLDTQAAAQARLLNGKHTAEQAAATAKEIGALTTEYEQVQAQIRQTSPRYAALTQPTPLSLKEVQTDVLDEDTLLLEYALGEERSWMWAVTTTSIKSFALPRRSEIEAAARRVYESLTARNQSAPNEMPERRQHRIARADAAYPSDAAALGRMLLGPVASELGSKRLLVVADGALQYVPFAALTVSGHPPSKGKALATNSGQQVMADEQPLIVNHEIVYLPSASVLSVLRREGANRKAAGKALAILADPVLGRDDPRLPAAKAARGSESEFVRLRFSRAEAEALAALTAPQQTLKALDFAASLETATGAELADYRIVHFATHAVINQRHPELSGIVLSQVDEKGQPRDGFLRLYEIYNLRLSADLVVLSACETALGKEVKGEGMIGLTRGFMYAGAPRVVASLWRADDRAAAELMKRFYQRMLGERMTTAAALRAAQVSLWREKRWEAPYFWAAFTLQGEWK